MILYIRHHALRLACMEWKTGFCAPGLLFSSLQQELLLNIIKQPSVLSTAAWIAFSKITLPLNDGRKCRFLR